MSGSHFAGHHDLVCFGPPRAHFPDWVANEKIERLREAWAKAHVGTLPLDWYLSQLGDA